MNRLKYNQARLAILDEIARLKIKRGDRLPSERALEKNLPFSVITIRHALQELNNCGFIEKRPSSGNYLSADIEETPFSAKVGLLRIMRKDRPPQSWSGGYWMPMQAYLKSRGLALVFAEAQSFDDALMDTLKGCIGIMLTDWVTPEWIEKFQVFKTPLYVLGPNPCRGILPGIEHDYRSASYMLTEILVQKGYKKIAMINGEKGHSDSETAFEGFLQAMKDNGQRFMAKRHSYKRFGHWHEDVEKFLFANEDCDAIINENAFTLLQCMWNLKWKKHPMLAWIHQDSNPHIQFPGIIAAFEDRLAMEGAKIFLDHLMLSKELPMITKIEPVLYNT